MITLANIPAPEPRNCSSAGVKSELDSPCRYINGGTSVNFGDFRAYAGKITEQNRFSSPVTSPIRLSLTRGARTLTAPAVPSRSA